MTIRGKAAIVGIGELPSRRTTPGRSDLGTGAEAIKLALDDAQLRKEDIDGLIMSENPATMAEYIGIKPRFAQGVAMMGASGTVTVQMAVAVIAAGYCETVLCVHAGARDPGAAFGAGGGAGIGIQTDEFEQVYGPAAGANNGYGLIYRRHMEEYGTTEAQLARIAVNSRFNALENPNAVFQGQPITVDDVLNSRYINEPLKLLESVMPCGDAAACIVTTAERARALPNRPAYILGAADAQTELTPWMKQRMVLSASALSAPDALKMAGYKASDMQFAQFYD
jgi:acetyl-CoA acetyltransferase